MTLLDGDEPAPFEVVGEGARSRWVLVCDHAGRSLPRQLGSLGLPARELERHIAWDLGAAELSRALGEALDACVILQNYSRLVIDCNRPLSSADSIATRSEDTSIPGNLEVSREQAELRARSIFEPYHARIRRGFDDRLASGRESLLVFVHTFTPTFRGVSRAWHAGVLYHRDRRLASPLLEALRREPGLVVGDNEPYAASASTDYGIIEHAERRGLPYVELEVRQDLLVDASGVRTWSERLARLLKEAASSRE